MSVDSYWLVLPALLLGVSAVSLVHFLLGRALRSHVKGAIATTILFIPILSFRHGQILLSLLLPALMAYRWYVPALAVATLCLLLVLRTDRRTLAAVHGAFNSMMALSLAIAAVPFIGRSLRSENAMAAELHRIEFSGVAPEIQPPDIYYIILDSYTGGQSLRRYWGFDNSGFLRALEHRGFYVAAESKSHYTSTVQSVAASLNMDTLNRNVLPFDLVLHNEVVGYLRARHFEVYNLSPFDLEGAPRLYSYFTTTDGSSSGLDFFFNNTGIGCILSSIRVESIPQQNIRTLMQLTRTVRESPAAPKFVYAHLMTPHGPFALDSNGVVIPVLDRKGWRDTSAYLGQLIGTNHLVLPVIDSILVHSRRDPIIIVQGDHGSRMLGGVEGVQESHAILNAYHLPRGGDKGLYASISPVNSFRTVLNYYFSEKLPLRKDYSDE